VIGKTISHYRVDRKIGEGGMGEVYLATDTKLGRQVALKFVPPALSSDADARDRLLREAQAASRLSHPNIMTVHSIEREGDRDFIVMEYVEGMALNDYCKAGNKSVAEILDLAIQLASGIDKAHAAGVVHRDLKPANIMVDADGRARILDFGLAKVENAVKLTQTGSTLGTMAYFSPEQAQGRQVDRRSDLFSFGVVLYEALAGRLPFHAEHQAAIVYALVHEQPQPVARFNNAVSTDLERIVTKCLAKSPDERYQSAADLLADLRRVKSEFARGGKLAAQPKSRPMLAVLPFANLGPAEDEYFADGMTEEIISRMAGVDGLGVISRTSAMRYKQTDKSIREIGSELGAEYILEGTVRWGRSKDGPSKVRITPQLIRVSDDTHLWSDRYDRTLDDVFEVQSDIAKQVFDNLNVSLLGNEQAAVEVRPTASADAYNAYLKALAYHRRPGYAADNYEKAAESLEEALRHDPHFALAHALLSIVQSDIYFHGHDVTAKRLKLAKAAVDRALELAPDLPQAHAALGLYHYRGFLDYPAAEKELLWAFEKNPDDEDIRLYLGAVRRRQGKFDEFLELCKESLSRNPRDPGLPMEIGTTSMLLRRYDEAGRYFDLALSIDPDAALINMFSALRHIHATGDITRAREQMRGVRKRHRHDWMRLAHSIEIYDRKWEAALALASTMDADLVFEQAFVYSRAMLEGIIYRYMGRADDARASLDTALAQLKAGLAEHPGDARFHSALGLVHAGLGNRDDARREAEKGVELYPTSRDQLMGPLREVDLAMTLAAIGDADEAIDILERVFTRPAWFSVNQARLDPAFDSLRDHPRFKALLAKDYPPF
jgi:non-specific serine/threonine protein kinase